MFGKKRKLEVKVVKDETQDYIPRNPNEVVREIGANASILIEKTVLGGAFLIGAYFAADTIRHCVIHTVAVKVTE